MLCFKQTYQSTQYGLKWISSSSQMDTQLEYTNAFVKTNTTVRTTKTCASNSVFGVEV